MLLKKSLFISLLPLFAFINVHKYYLSATEVTYSEKSESLQITSRYFIDDFESMMKERYNIDPQLVSDNEIENIDYYFNKYLQGRFTIKINGERIKLAFLGKEYDNDVVKCYIESEKVKFKSIQNIEIKNSSLFEMFEDQQNIIHIQMGSIKKSYNLHKDSDTILLSF